MPFVFYELINRKIYTRLFLSFKFGAKLFGQEPLGADNQIKTEFIRKLSSFKVQFRKTLYQNNFTYVAFFFTFFKGYKLKLLDFLG